MKITLLGTAAAEAIPNPFCDCLVCRTARQEGGRERRARSVAVINDDLLIDLGPDIISSANHWGVYLGNTETLLITHRHEDHWLPQNLIWRRSTFTPNLKTHLSMYGPGDVFRDLPPSIQDSLQISWRSIKGGDQWTSGRYSITAVPATHGDGKLEAVLYVIDDGVHRVFYATDTAPMTDEAYQILDGLGSMDLILLDATMGPASGGQAHHGIPQFIQTRERMIDIGLLDPSKTVLAAHHFSHNNGLTHADHVMTFDPFQVKVAYDGWTVNL